MNFCAAVFATCEKLLALFSRHWMKTFGTELDAIERAALVSYTAMTARANSPLYFFEQFYVSNRELISHARKQHIE
jgi:hypothetical protein